jgi:hypothetical protein
MTIIRIIIKSPTMIGNLQLNASSSVGMAVDS